MMMNWYLLTAAALSIFLAIIHSGLGERWIFREAAQLNRKYRGIIWASWHMVSLLGVSMCVLFVGAALDPAPGEVWSFVLMTLSIMTFGSAALVLYGTKGRHPGWIGLLAISLLSWFA